MITGFLGAGKTTFLKNFISMFAGNKIQLIINEFGREGVDGDLLADLGAFLEEIAGGSVFCSCRLDQFEKVLTQSKGLDPDVILVEASGLSNPTGVRRLFTLGDRFPHIEYKGAVCLVDAVRFPVQYATAMACVKQIAASDVAVVNKTDKAKEEELSKTLELIRDQRPDIPVIQTSFGKVDKEILELLERSEYVQNEDMPLTGDLTVRKLFVKIAPTLTPYSLQKFIEMFSEVTFRVKGFVDTTEGLYLADCVGNVVSLEPYTKKISDDKRGFLVVLSGAGMPVKSRIKKAAAWYPDDIISIEQ